MGFNLNALNRFYHTKVKSHDQKLEYWKQTVNQYTNDIKQNRDILQDYTDQIENVTDQADKNTNDIKQNKDVLVDHTKVLQEHTDDIKQMTSDIEKNKDEIKSIINEIDIIKENHSNHSNEDGELTL